MLLPTTDKQFEFWSMRRSGQSNIAIAEILGISRQAVSRALLTMDQKIESVMREMADANQIAVLTFNVQRGVLIGRSIPLNTRAIIFVSVSHGVQVWYEHDGDCDTCERYTACIELIWDYARELGVRLHQTEDPTRMAEELFSRIEEILHE